MSKKQADKARMLKTAAKKAIKPSLPKKLTVSKRGLNRKPRHEALSEINLHQMVRMYIMGSTDDEVAFAFGIPLMTMLRWKAEFPQLREAIEAGKEAATDRVEQSLFKRAIGYDAKEVTRERSLDENLKPKLVVTKVVTKHFSPETTACMHWLHTQRSRKWKQAVNAQQNNFFFNPIQAEAVDGDIIGRAQRNSGFLQRYGAVGPEAQQG